MTSIVEYRYNSKESNLNAVNKILAEGWKVAAAFDGHKNENGGLLILILHKGCDQCENNDEDQDNDRYREID